MDEAFRDCRPSVFVVDDDDGIRQALTRAFRQEGVAVAVFASAAAFLDAYRPGAPGCLLLDMKMPGMGGLELQGELFARGIALPVIVITGTADVAIAVQAMKAGALDLVEKPFEMAALLTLVRKAFERDAQCRASAARSAEALRKIALLTVRERQVFDLVVQDKSCKAIANKLGISHRTVEAHRSRILLKMDAASVAELMRLAYVVSAHDSGASKRLDGACPGAT